MLCADCKTKTTLEDMIRKYAPRNSGYYVCRDCFIESHGAGLYPHIMPLRGISTKKQENRLNSLLRWVLG